MTRRLLRAGLALLVTALQVLLALDVLGVPDPRAAFAFLTGAVPTGPQALALLETLLWVVLAVFSIVAVVTVLREAWAAVPRRALRRGWGIAVVLCGASILIAGLAHQLAPPSTGLGGGGSVVQATQVLGR